MVVEIRESYKDWTAPLGVHQTVAVLVESVPGKYLYGLKRVILTNTSSLNRSRKRRRIKHRRRKRNSIEANGSYHQAWQGNPASIELFVDNIVAGYSRRAMKVPLIREMLFAEVVFHEIGHHIHKTSFPDHREDEDVADEWAERLSQSFFRRKYWYMIPFRRIFRLATKVGIRLARYKVARAQQAIGADPNQEAS